MILTPESVQAEIKRTRHKKERPLYIFLSILGVLTAAAVVISKGDSTVMEAILSLLEESGVGGEEIDFKVFTTLIFVIGIILSGLGLVLALVCLYIIAEFIAAIRGILRNRGRSQIQSGAPVRRTLHLDKRSIRDALPPYV